MKIMTEKLSIIISVVASAIMLAASCGKNGVKTDGHHEVAIVPLHIYIYNVSSQRSGNSSDSTGSVGAEAAALLKTLGYEPTYTGMLDYSDSKAVKVFTPDIVNIYSDLTAENEAINDVLTNAEAEGLKIPSNLRFATVAWGRPQSMIFCDSVLLIGLNHYLGKDYAGYAGFPEYIREQKDRRFLPYDLAEAIVATYYPYSPGEYNSVSNRLIYEGAIAYTRYILAGEDDESGALGYDAQQLEMLGKRRDELQNTMIAKKLMFDSSPSVQSRLFDPSPATQILADGLPGRAGRYIGYMLVKDYMDRHGDMTLADILSPEFYGGRNPLESVYR